jgi:hypothetical protein
VPSLASALFTPGDAARRRAADSRCSAAHSSHIGCGFCDRSRIRSRAHTSRHHSAALLFHSGPRFLPPRHLTQIAQSSSPPTGPGYGGSDDSRACCLAPNVALLGRFSRLRNNAAPASLSTPSLAQQQGFGGRDFPRDRGGMIAGKRYDVLRQSRCRRTIRSQSRSSRPTGLHETIRTAFGRAR